jgi:hypothetical protein
MSNLLPMLCEGTNPGIGEAVRRFLITNISELRKAQ